MNNESETPLIDVSVLYDKECIKIPNDYSCQGLTGFKWQKVDYSTWMFITRDYNDAIEPAIRSFIESGILKRGNVIQAGGNSGLYPLLLTKYFDMIFTFEPDPLNFHCLVNNCQAAQITKLNLALGDKHAKVQTHVILNDNRGMNQVKEISNMDTDLAYIPQVPLDVFKFDNVSLIMLDVEGMECSILKGAKKTIQKNKPMIILSKTTVDDSDLLQYASHLDTFGYVLYSVLGNNDRVYIIP